MQFTITLDQLMAAGLVLTMAALAWVSSRNRKLAEQLRKEAHEISENAKRDIDAHKAEMAKAEKAKEHMQQQWKALPEHVRQQVKNHHLVVPIIHQYQQTCGDDLKRLVMFIETKDGTDIRLFDPEAMKQGWPATKWSEGTDKELLLMLARGIAKVERAESGIIDVLQAMLDEQRDIITTEKVQSWM
jgi:hypothetical protein